MRALLAVSLIALLAPAANATPIRVDFNISLSQTLGTVSGTNSANGGGYLMFDTDLALPTNRGLFGLQSASLPTLDLSFDWLGQHFDSSSGALTNVTFDVFGNLLDWEIDSVQPNLCGFRCVQWGTSDFTLLAFGGGSGGALLTQSGSIGLAIGSVSWTRGQIQSVPEPGTLGLMALGFAGLLIGRRKILRN